MANFSFWLLVLLGNVLIYSYSFVHGNSRWISRCSMKSGTAIIPVVKKEPKKVPNKNMVDANNSDVLKLVAKKKPKKVLDKNMFSSHDVATNVYKDVLKFTIYGEPQVLERHRTLKTGMTYNPSASKQQLFRSVALPHLPSIPWNGSLEVNLVFHFARPKNHFGTGSKSSVLKPDKSEVFQNNRKDLDNLVKFVLDSLNKVAYEDDCQIAMISSAKLYASKDERERTEVNIRRLNMGDAIVKGNFAR